MSIGTIFVEYYDTLAGFDFKGVRVNTPTSVLHGLCAEVSVGTDVARNRDILLTYLACKIENVLRKKGVKRTHEEVLKAIKDLNTPPVSLMPAPRH